ncbi:hypothetical protein [Streptomyces phaeochromogenes]
MRSPYAGSDAAGTARYENGVPGPADRRTSGLTNRLILRPARERA